MQPQRVVAHSSIEPLDATWGDFLSGVNFSITVNFFCSVDESARPCNIHPRADDVSFFNWGKNFGYSCVLGGGGRPAKMQRSQMTHQIELEWEKRNNINNNGVEAFFYGFSSFCQHHHHHSLLVSAVCMIKKNEKEKTLNEF